MTEPLSISFPPVKKLHNSRQPFRGRNVGPTLQYTHLNIASGDDEKMFHAEHIELGGMRSS